MIQEKDFLYRVPVKNVLVTTPRQQVRNPEILVDVEGGEFMHGNILDANSTNKLINQSVKDAVDNKLIESGYVTKDLLEAETTRATEQENSLKTLIGAETSARTKGDEDLSSKIKAEQTRAEGKEKEISDKLAIVNGDSNTEGSFRKAIADVVAAAPEDLDTLKEIADKLAGNDDLHTALNQAITEKADASALLNEVTRATGAESGLQAAIATKADATALEGAKTEFDEKINNLKFIPYNSTWNDSYSVQHYKLPDRKGIDLSAYTVSTKLFGDTIKIANESESLSLSRNSMYIDSSGRFYVNVNSTAQMILSQSNSIISAKINDKPVIEIKDATGTKNKILKLNADGITLPNGDDNHVLTSNAGIIDITQYALKSELPTVPTKTSQLTNDSNFIAANHISDIYLGFEKDLKIYSENTSNITTISHTGINFKTDINDVAIDENGFFVSRDSDDAQLCSFTPSGIKFAGKTDDDIPTANGTFTSITEKVNDIVNSYNLLSQQNADSRYALASTVDSLSDEIDSIDARVSGKQELIIVNDVDVAGIETADITKLRTIVNNLVNALNLSGLISI